jgi:hypothetical protein
VPSRMYAIFKCLLINLLIHFDTGRRVETVPVGASIMSSPQQKKAFALLVALKVILYDGEVSAKFVG